MKYLVMQKQTVVKNSEYQINEKVNESSHMVQILGDIGARVILILMMGEGLDY